MGILLPIKRLLPLQSSLLIHSHENTSNPEKKKEAKKKIRCGGERLRAGRGKRGAKERRLRRLKEKVTSPFPPCSGAWK